MFIVSAAGSGHARGHELGKALAGPLELAWAAWCAHFSANDYNPLELAKELEESPAWETAYRELPDLVEELQVMASSAGMSWQKVAALSMLDESWSITGGMACTAVAITNATTRIAGQNMDLPNWTQGLQTALRIQDQNDLQLIVATYPGSLATCGMNSNGVVIVVNALDLATNPSGMPVDFVVRGALHQPSAVEAIDLIRSISHGVGQSYTVLDDQNLFMVEADANGVRDVPLDATLNVHTNHALTTPSNPDESSRERFTAVTAIRDQLRAKPDLEQALLDRSTGVCTPPGHWGRDLYSFMGIIGDSRNRRVWLSANPPVSQKFDEFQWHIV